MSDLEIPSAEFCVPITACAHTERVDGQRVIEIDSFVHCLPMFAISNFPDPAEIHGLHTIFESIPVSSYFDPSLTLFLFSLTLMLPVSQR
jgi:hypothetical protein